MPFAMMEQCREKTGRRVIIRPAQKEDLAQMVELLGRLFSIEADFTPDPAKQQLGLALMLADPSTRCIMAAEIDSEVIGMCTIQRLISTAEGAAVGLVEDLVVKEGWRGIGIGARLLSAVEEWARRQGLARLQLVADRNNQSALTFYRRRNWFRTDLICMRCYP